MAVSLIPTFCTSIVKLDLCNVETFAVWCASQMDSFPKTHDIPCCKTVRLRLQIKKIAWQEIWICCRILSVKLMVIKDLTLQRNFLWDIVDLETFEKQCAKKHDFLHFLLSHNVELVWLNNTDQGSLGQSDTLSGKFVCQSIRNSHLEQCHM